MKFWRLKYAVASLLPALSLLFVLMTASFVGQTAAPGPQSPKFAGVRSSSYGIKPFPSPEGWGNAMKTMAGYFPGSTPVAIWIVGRLNGRTTGVTLEFPSPHDGVDYGPLFTFSETDEHEPFLDYFDANGIKVFLQAEPGYAAVDTAIDLILRRYKHHPCVIGFGIDVEWFQNARTDGPNAPATDGVVKAWEARVKSHNPDYRLFVKHFHINNLPPTYRGDVVFVDDSQQFTNVESFLAEYKEFADFFYPNPVMFQIGYRDDKKWWSSQPAPIPKTLGEKLAAQTRQDSGIVWVDFTLRDVLPTDGSAESVAAAGTQGSSASSFDKREMRGIRFRLPDLFNEAAPREIVDNVASANLNTILVSVSSAELNDPRFREMLDAARARDIAVHAVIATIVAGEIGTSSPSKPDPATHAVDSSGNLSADWLCPSKPKLQEWVLDLAAGMARLGVDGVQLDYIRFGPPDLCYCDVCQRDSHRWLETHPGRTREDWRDSVISDLVDKVRNSVKGARRDAVFSCSTWTVGPGQQRTNLTPTGEGFGWRQGQDFLRFREQADFLRPMLYSCMFDRDGDWIVDMTRLAIKNAAGKTKIIPGVALSVGHLHLAPGDIARVVPKLRAAGAAGVVFFDYRSIFDPRNARLGYLDELQRVFSSAR